MNNATRLRRLKHLVVVMKAVPVEKFNMCRWMQKEHFIKPVEVEVPKSFIAVDCRTAGCALGWAALDKKFIRAGLSVIGNKGYGNVKFKNKQAAEAGEFFFGLRTIEADGLFQPAYYDIPDIKPRHVIAKVKKLIKKYGVSR